MMRKPILFAATALFSLACSRPDPTPAPAGAAAPAVETGIVQQAVASCPTPSGGSASCTLDDGNISADTTVYSGFPNDNFGNGWEMCAGTTNKAIIRFDVSVIPSGMVIETASLQVSVGRVANGGTASASVFRVTGPANWTESSPTYPSSASRSCGTTTQNMTRSNNHAYPVGQCTNVAPEVAGYLGGACGLRNVTLGDVSGTSAITFNKLTVAASSSAQNTTITAGTETFSGATMASNVQGWKDGTLTNNGWAIIADAGSGQFVMSSSEGSGTFPHLVVTYKRKDGQICSSSAECDSGACSGRCCSSGSLCTDTNTCTTDACNSSGTCTHTNNTVACDDLNPCTLSDTCNGAGACVGTPMTCLPLDQCHNAGTCSGGACSNPIKTNGTSCDDSDGCTINDTCQAGTCTGTTKPCPAIDQCHTAGTCSGAGVCSTPNQPNGTSCSDGNSCTSGETCQSGVCTGGVGKVCTASDQCHDVGTCSGGVCTDPPKANGSPCNFDSNACTANDSCQAGVCTVGSAVVCPAPDQCHNPGTCAPATGLCSNPNKTNGTACNDGLACTTPDTCTNGTCGGPARVCDDGIVCTVDGCSEAAGGCTFNTGGCGCTTDAKCDDGNACNGKETCNLTTLTCSPGTPVDCSSLTDDCNTGTCAPATGACSPVPQPNGTACDDGNKCTTGDACQSGVCKATPVVCPLPDQCHNAGTCSASTGTCSNPAKPNGTTCNDGNACTTSDTCVGGTCTGGPALACNDSNGCTVDGCAPATGCTFTPGNAGTVCVPASCTGGRETQVSACTGSAAACPTAVTKACAPYACGATACLTKCTVDTDCALGNYCAAGGVCTAKLNPGAKCSAGNQCVSTFCVDGVCCNQDCDGQCEACNLSNKVGTCSPVTGKPVAPRAPCIGNGTGCDGACDGTNTTACVVPGQSTQCRAPSCNAATGVATLAENCDGSGACPSLRTQSCAPGICGQTQCTGCSTNADCGTDEFCRGGVCKPQSVAGTKCSIDAECSSGHCVDGVCCNADCTGQCESCNQPSALGKCTPIPANQQPAQGRPACAGKAPCGGVCDGMTTRSCVYPGPGVSCRDAQCVSGNAILAAFCDGAGSCPAQTEKACPTGSTCINGTLCGGTPNSCTSDAGCSQDEYCAGGVCSSKNENGSTCNTPAECRSGICVDGFCCTQACAGQCEACDVPGSEGTCRPIVGAPHGSRQACSTDGTICGGSCNGAVSDRCNYSGLSTACRPGKCAGGLADLAAFCQGNGFCAPLQQQSCDPVGCAGTRCDGPCLVDDDCAATEYCSAGMCVPKLPNGVTCGAPGHCTSGNCVDGLCCDSACSGQCQACDQVGHLGVCTSVGGAPRAGRPGCSGSGACGGFCDGSSGTTCTMPGPSVVCGVAFCAEGAVTNEPKCNAAATCVIPAPQSCDPYQCDPSGAGCLSSCQLDSDCATGLVCVNGDCTQPTPDGGVVDAGARRDASTGTGNGTGGRRGSGGASSTTDSGTTAAGGQIGMGAGGGSSGSMGTAGSRPGGSAGTTSVDAGLPTGPDAGKAPAASHDDSGCGCRTAGSSEGGASGIAGALAGLLLLAGRRGPLGAANRTQRKQQRRVSSRPVRPEC